jgi:hypothetical protein
MLNPVICILSSKYGSNMKKDEYHIKEIYKKDIKTKISYFIFGIQQEKKIEKKGLSISYK